MLELNGHKIESSKTSLTFSKFTDQLHTNLSSLTYYTCFKIQGTKLIINLTYSQPRKI